MKIKIGELIGKKEALEKLVDTKVTGLVSFKLAKAVKAINEEYSAYTDANNELIKKYGTEQEGNSFKIEPNTPEIKKYVDELTPLLEQEVDFNFVPIKLDEFGEDFTLETRYMAALIDFVIVE